MEEIKLSDDVFEQIKDFYHKRLREKQELLIDKLILNEELKKRYKEHGLCKVCKQPNTDSHGSFWYEGYWRYWCQSCNAKRFQQNFKNWTSGNNEVDEFIQNAQIKAINHKEVLEWIEYDRFDNVEFLAKVGFGTVYKAFWKDGCIENWGNWSRWERVSNSKVVLKYLYNSQDTAEFLGEVESHLITNDSSDVVRCYGITKDSETNCFMMVIDYYAFKKYYIKHGVCKECKHYNTGGFLWCQSCNANRLQQNFKNWTSNNHDIDEFIQNAQLKPINYWNVLEWIEYDRFENVEFLAKCELGTVYKTIWKDGWVSESDQWERVGNSKVVLKCLHNSSQDTVEFLREVKSHLITNDSSDVVRCYGITKDSETNSFMMVMEYNAFIKYYVKYGICKECKHPNTGDNWCQSCNSKRFQQNFKNWSSGNYDIDEVIQNAQHNAKNHKEVLEWIEYGRFENIEYLVKDGVGITWKDGFITHWIFHNNQWNRSEPFPVFLKHLNNLQDITVEFSREIESYYIINHRENRDGIYPCYGITKDPETNTFMMVIGSFRSHHVKHGICKVCMHPNTGDYWCQLCNAKHFQQNFKNWTSENHVIDEFIQNAQLKARNYWNVLEWIEYDKFENIEYLVVSEFGPVYKAIWKDRYIYCWDSGNNQWERYKEYYKKGQPVTLKCLPYDSQNITVEFLKEIESNLMMNHLLYGITKHPETNNFMIAFNMKETKLADDVTEQVKDFDHQKLTEVQEFLVDKLILNKELKEHYKKHGLCKGCKQPKTGYDWCQSCNANHFQQNFKNWSSRNHNIDKFIQNAQLKAKHYVEAIEWIEYYSFENVEYLTKGGFGSIHKAIWKDGYIKGWDSGNNQWKRVVYSKVVLKYLYNLQDTAEFLGEIEPHNVIRCYGITKVPETNNFMMVMEYNAFEKYYIKHGICEECKQPNTGHLWCQSCNAKRFQQNYIIFGIFSLRLGRKWTSGNYIIDEFIQNTQKNAKNHKEVLEWIEYDRFENVEYLAKGGFGITYKASWKDGYIENWDSKNNQWNRNNNQNVVLKCLHNSQNISVEFLKEIESHLIMNSTPWVITCYGITKYPKTNDFMMVMYYAENGSLRHYLNNNFNSLKWDGKFYILQNIAYGLKNIHNNELIHRDFHCRNIVNRGCGNNIYAYITDLGLCQPANVKPSQSGNKQIYGVLPYVAPEVLRGNKCTQASDIYGFGIIAFEVCTGFPPYYNKAHEELLAIRICHGLRPTSDYKIPQLILDIIKQCWDSDPLKRPKAEELQKLLYNLYRNAKKDSLINKQIKEVDIINEQLSSLTPSLSTNILSFTTHPQAVYTSRLLDYKNLPEPKNAESEYEYSESERFDFTKHKINSKDESN